MTAGPPDKPASASRKAMEVVSGVLGPLIALLCVLAFFSIADRMLADGTFSTFQNLKTVAVQTCLIAVGALGSLVIIVSGGIDLSVGTALAFSATVLAWCLRADYPWPLALAAGIGTGCLAGLVNGLLVSVLRIVPFIVTLGTMSIYLGVAKKVADETTVNPSPAQIPDWIPRMVSLDPSAEWVGMPAGVWLTLLLAALLAVVLRYTVFGRYVYALGSNESTARLCGINVPLVKIAVYTLGGFFVGVAGLFQFARISSGNPVSGSGLELQIIAAVVIGGASLSGGRGSVLGALAGAAMIRVIYSGCAQIGISNAVQDVVLGVILIAAATVDQLRQELRKRRLGG